MHGQPVILNTTLNITDKKRNEQELERYRHNLEQLVRERTEELSKANAELKSANELLISQQEELQVTLNELHQAQDQLIESEKMASLGILAAGVAHEINNPLNFIQGGVMGLESYLNENLKDHVHAVETLLQGIHVGVDRAARIVTSLNHFSRMNEACDEIFDVNQVVENCLTMIHNKIRYRIEVVKEFAPESLTIMGNEGKLHQVFLNILSNAYQAIENNGTIRIRNSFKNDQVILKITDSGLGIAPENLNRIFNPFFTTKDPGKGTGLGLSISYKIIQDHNGTIQYKSAPNQGTTVTIVFPYHHQDGS
jgi:signal transduction histidine kinase